MSQPPPTTPPTPSATDRRAFLRSSALAVTSALSLGPFVTGARAAAAEKLDVGFMGLGTRGIDLLKAFLATSRVSVSWLCDVDARAVEKASALVKTTQVRAFKATSDFRRLLEDRRMAGLVIATPDHWHAPAAILALKAGKPVYLEKPVSHNPREGELLVELQKRTRLPVQIGLQRRSQPWTLEAIQRVQSGELGTIRFARAWYASDRGSIGFGQLAPIPEGLDFPLWQGPAPSKPYRDNIAPYNWHWFWHWGTGELGNNGVHFLDLARWALKLDCPLRVTAAGGRLHFEDDQETPDTQTVTYEYDQQTLVWEHRSCVPTRLDGETAGVSFYGAKASLTIGGSGYRIHALDGRELARVDGGLPMGPHVNSFLDCLENRTRTPTAPAEEGTLSTFLCHLGNIALRAGEILTLNPATRQLVNARNAAKYWSREYQSGWQPTL